MAKAKGKEGINLLVAAAHLGVLIGISSLAVLTSAPRVLHAHRTRPCSGVTGLASTDQ